MSTLRVETPEAFLPLYDTPAPYKIFYGGRSSGKSWQFARALLVQGMRAPLRILCAREWQTSLKDSVYALLKDQIEERLKLGGFYELTREDIRGANGTRFLFKGLRRDIAEIKSTEGIDRCWVEEAQKVSAESWEVLIPTIRKAGSEIWISFNPGMESDPTYQRFVVAPPEGAVVRKVSWRDNSELPDRSREQMRELRRKDPDAYAHVWGGDPWTRSDSQVLAGLWVEREFTPEATWDGPYFGADWGFARDPSTLVRLWLADGRLWIDYAVGGVELSHEDTAALFRQIPAADKHTIRADSSRPETINGVAKLGLRVVACEKWPGSVEDGISHLRGYEEIVIHPRCAGVIEEARLWRYKTDRLTGDVLPKLQEGWDHYWDAVRYGLGPMIKRAAKPRVYFPGQGKAS